MNSYVFLIVWLLCAIWIYSDAQKRNLKNPAAWAIMGFLLGLIGVICYWIWVIRPNKHDS